MKKKVLSDDAIKRTGFSFSREAGGYVRRSVVCHVRMFVRPLVCMYVCVFAKTYVCAS